MVTITFERYIWTLLHGGGNNWKEKHNPKVKIPDDWTTMNEWLIKNADREHFLASVKAGPMLDVQKAQLIILYSLDLLIG